MLSAEKRVDVGHLYQSELLLRLALGPWKGPFLMPMKTQAMLWLGSLPDGHSKKD